MAAAKGMTASEYRDKILFPHGKEWIKARFQKFLSLHPDAEGNPKPPSKNNIFKASMKNFIAKKKQKIYSLVYSITMFIGIQ
ncbi:MAG: hypothetical protein ACLRSW_05550 [Christensenellaceae bacterium]